MTAQGAVSRQKERGRPAVRIKEGDKNDGAGRRKPPEGAGTPRRQNQRRRE